MAVANPSAHPAPPPRFAGQALALLLPVGILALLAGVALARDWRAARSEAAARAQELAVATADRVTELLLPPRTAGPGPGSGPSSFIPDTSDIAFVVGSSNRLLHPAPPEWPPTPEPIETGNLPPDRRESWEAARQAMAAGDWAEAIRQYEGLADPAGRDLVVGPGNPAEASDPNPRVTGNARLDRAIAFEHLGRTRDAADAFELVLAHPPASAVTTEAGVPVAHLAALRLLDLDPPAAESRDRWTAESRASLATLLADSPPSPFVDAIVERLRPLAAAPGAPWLNHLLAVLERGERGRRGHAAALGRYGTEAPWPGLFWVPDADPAWLAIRRDPGTAVDAANHGDRGQPEWGYALIPETRLQSALEEVRRAYDRRGEFTVRVTLAGRRLTVDGGSGNSSPAVEAGELATTSRPGANGFPVMAAAGLVDPRAYFGGQRRRLLLFGGLLAAALFAAGLSVRATRRSLLRQHELNTQKTNFVSSVSHELRAPLGSIRLLAEGLERGTIGDDARRQEYFQLIAQETRRLGALVENVLDFSRIEQGRKAYEFEPTDLPALVSGTVRIFEPLAVARGVPVTCDPSSLPETGELVADGRALQQALLNLLDNALKHSAAGQPIHVALTLRRPPPSEGPAEFHLSVRDEGPGIPAAEQARIFEPFYRRGSELRRETPGIGIGLSIVRHIVDAHHGRVDVRSHPGAGAEFTLVLPTTRPPPSPRPPLPCPVS